MLQEKALALAPKGTGATVDFSGRWKNDLTSEMELNQSADGALSGTYESAVSDGHKKTSGKLLGYVDGDLISFVVHWDEFQAITAWVGQLDPKNDKVLKTLWQMTRQVDPGEEWASINAGADNFTKQT